MSTLTPKRFVTAVVFFVLVGIAVAWAGGEYEMALFAVVVLVGFCLVIAAGLAIDK